MRTRPLIVIAAAAALALPASATAATACKLINDVPNDAYVGSAVLAAASVPPLDIHSADVATGSKTLVAVLRLASTNQADHPMTMPGLQLSFTFEINGVVHRFARQLGPNGTVLQDTATADGAALSGVSVKVAAKSITWTVPRASVPKLRGRGAVFTRFYASSSAYGATDQAPDGGTASGSRYVDRQRSCVRAS